MTIAKEKSWTKSTLIGVIILAGVGFVEWRSGAQSATAGEKEPAKDVIEMVKLDNIVVNLYDEDEVHYLKCSIELEPANTKASEFAVQRAAIVRNDALLYLSSLTVADTPGEKLKIDIQNKLVSRVNKALGQDAIKHAYFVEFVVQ